MNYTLNLSILRKSALAVALASVATIAHAQAPDYKKVHQKAVLVDTHNDVLISILEGNDISKDLRGKTHSDLSRFKEGGVDVQFFSVWSDETGDYKYAMLQIDTLKAVVDRNPKHMLFATNYKDIEKAVEHGKMASMIGVEGGHMIDSDLKKLENLYNAGARYMTLTWNNSTPWATSAADETSGKIPESKKGLTKFGKQVVRRMNQLGMMVDLSHVGEKTFWDAMATTRKPVLVSHSCVHSIAPVPRNLKDDQIKAIAKNGGVIQLNFFSGFLDPEFDKRNKQFRDKHKVETDSLRALNWPGSNIAEFMRQKYPNEVEQVRPPLSILFDHLDYIVKLVGVDYVGMGSDFDGVTSTPRQLDGVDDFPVITKELLARGYSEEDVYKIMGGNALRVLKANEKK
ncbi:dipeptidase [Pontibacter cellulosilyticus]|uniref:Membrane dipeptidase n=1 Tax=Pontibacter cellulosilyticus TaxID=1720253 RepID=A0A923N6U3_9BACT|nr:dipeptidase [Pontibacter cellulosilyticus]MBC5991565.1 membrane dipeptidase [Pontibacter cellulosilyticus]